MSYSHCALTHLLKIDFPIIVAPMFLVSNESMIIAAVKAGVTGAIPALNYRSVDELRQAIRSIKSACSGPFGINLIVNRSNFLYKEQLQVCCEEKVDYIITSLGSPAETIRCAKSEGILVFCDVTNVDYAKKVEALGADALIAVNKKAGGHSGSELYQVLVPALKSRCAIPVISAGGIGNADELHTVLSLGADGASIGSIFIASVEAGVSNAYKQACIDYGADDIVMTTKLSGTPCTVINTPYVQKVGTKQNIIEKFLHQNKRLKKWFKALTYIRGTKLIEKAAFNTTYKSVWCAGPSIEHVKAIRSVVDIVTSLKKKSE